MKIRKNVGITLISLVITIIVLIILAGISINLVLGENGLLTQAQKAKDKTDEAVKNEISSLGELEDILHETETGIVVEKVEDANPGELEQSETDTYTINSIEDLVAFAHNVTTGTDNYEGKTVKLGLSLDFASTKSYVNANRTDYEKYGYNGELKKLLNENGFIPIGTQKRNIDSNESIKSTFNGTFDGNKKTIYNLTINKTVQSADTNGNIGIFTVNNGTIQDLNIKNANLNVDMQDNNKWKCVGILAAVNSSKGKIDRCSISGKISGNVLTSCDVGGIAGSSSGEISNSFSEVDMSITGESGFIYEGLIVGSCSGTIKNVYSKGTIHPQKCGVVGGVVGNCNISGEVKNAYTVSKIKAEYDDNTGYLVLGAFCQDDQGKRISNCYYLENNIEIIGNGRTLSKIGEEKTEEYMKGEEFVDKLNNGQEGNPWKQDINNINDGYPILSWQ